MKTSAAPAATSAPATNDSADGFLSLFWNSAPVEFARDWFTGLDLGQPSIACVVLVAVAMWVCGSRSKAGSAYLVRLLTTVVAAAAFLVSVAFGAVILAAALAWRMVCVGRGGFAPGRFAIAWGVVLALEVTAYAFLNPTWWAAQRASFTLPTFGILPLLFVVALVVLVVFGWMLLKSTRTSSRDSGVGPHDDVVPEHLRDPRRSFSASQIEELLALGGGRCAIPRCAMVQNAAFGVVLQADHIHPHSRGGRTEVSNGQMLCASHNHNKSDQTMDEYLTKLGM